MVEHKKPIHCGHKEAPESLDIIFYGPTRKVPLTAPINENERNNNYRFT